MSKLSKAEAELYDRQIRLWGIESQEKLRAANVLLIGAKALGSEIAKNILLSGINSLTILDDDLVTDHDLTKNFLLSADSVGQKISEAILAKAQMLNPLVAIEAAKLEEGQLICDLNQAFFAQFTICIGTGLHQSEIIHLGTICKEKNIQLIVGDVFGMFGFALLDLHNHDYFEDKVVYKNEGSRKRAHTGEPAVKGTGDMAAKSKKETIQVKSTIHYPDVTTVLTINEDKDKEVMSTKKNRRNPYFYLVPTLLDFRAKHKRAPSIESKAKDVTELDDLLVCILRRYNVDPDKKDGVFAVDKRVATLELLFGEVVPICSIVGGVVAQEVIKAVSHKSVPIHNCFLLDPHTFNGREETISAP